MSDRSARLPGRAGLFYGVGAYLLWGLSPLYWPLIHDTAATEVVAHRIIWSLVFVSAVLAVRKQWAFVRELRRQPRAVAALAAAGAAVAANWIMYIWAVNHDHLVESSLGYFMNPLIVVVLGVVVLHERMRRMQWVAVGIATLAVVVLTVDYGRPPWIALVLASSFSLYGLLKKQTAIAPLESLGVETAALLLPALGYLVAISIDGSGSVGRTSVGQHALLVGAGIFTAIPLVLFGAAAQRIPLVTLGLLQYLNPTMQFALGVFLRHEPFPASRLIGFVLVWIALLIFIIDGLRRTPSIDPVGSELPDAEVDADADDLDPRLIEPEPNPV